jgi:hypothetical protein
MTMLVRTVLLLGLGVACTTPFQAPPTAEELATAEYGPRPPSEDDLLAAFVRARYRDLSILRVTVGQPRRAWYGKVGSITEKRDIRFGWAVRFKGYRLSGLALNELAVVGQVFIRRGRIEGVSDANGFGFTGRT